jgi:hypothetical protein
MDAHTEWGVAYNGLSECFIQNCKHGNPNFWGKLIQSIYDRVYDSGGGNMDWRWGNSKPCLPLRVKHCPPQQLNHLPSLPKQNTSTLDPKPYFDGPHMPRGLVVPWLFQRAHVHMNEIEQHCPIRPVAACTLNTIVTNSQCPLTLFGRFTWAPNSNKTFTTSTQPFSLARDKVDSPVYKGKNM